VYVAWGKYLAAATNQRFNSQIPASNQRFATTEPCHELGHKASPKK